MKYLAFEKSIGGVVFRKQSGKFFFLLLRYRSGQWDFPKGHMEETENELETLQREIKEETNLSEIEIFKKPRISVRYFYRAWGNEKKERIREKRGIFIFKKVVFYPVLSRQKEVKIDFENKDFAWFSLENALKRLGNKDSKKVLQKVAMEIGL
jgi:8-oxo-dGTP pyrophosphatase MutT (NUDIX family)